MRSLVVDAPAARKPGGLLAALSTPTAGAECIPYEREIMQASALHR